MAQLHSDLIKKTLKEFSASGLATCFRIETGVARSLDGSRIISFGSKGMSDIIGITSNGLFISIEIKIGRDDLREDQINFKNMIQKNKGLHYVIRNEQDLSSAISDVRHRIIA